MSDANEYGPPFFVTDRTPVQQAWDFPATIGHGTIGVSSVTRAVPATGGAASVASGSVPLLRTDGPTAAQFERLLALLSLADEERSFVRAALAPGQGKDFFLVLADWLEERGRDEAARRMRKTGEAP